jgi:AcrR family transcriptional regulator
MAARAGLSKESVVETAATLADAAGLEEVTLATLAERLGVRTPTLYHYVAGLAGLRRELALRSLREQAREMGRAVMGRSGAAAVRAQMDAYRAYVKAHPGQYAATVRAAGPSDAELATAQTEVLEMVLRALDAFHLAPDDAIHAVRIGRALVHGFATLELAGGFGLPQEVDETFRRLLDAYIRALQTEAQPAP